MSARPFLWSSWRFLIEFASLTIPQKSHYLAQGRVAALAAPADDAPQLVVGVVEQRLERRESLALQLAAVPLQKALEHQIVLEKAAPAVPAQAVHLLLGHTERFTISSLILPMALVGLRFLGQASTQFMMV